MNAVSALLERKVRGVRVVDLAGVACLALIVLVVYASKAGGGAEAAKIADTTRLIGVEEQQVRLLQARDAYLTQPRRIRDLSKTYLHMGPVPVGHETTPEALLRVDAPPASTPAPAPGHGADPAPARPEPR